jgi:hypothetical protein
LQVLLDNIILFSIFGKLKRDSYPQMINVYDLYNNAKADGIVLSFRGNVTEDFMASVFIIMEARLDGDAQQQRIRKKVNNILVECLQNVFHHMDEFTREEAQEDARAAIFLVCRDSENKYSIVTGNHILNANVEGLRAKIDKVNAMTQEELKSYYQALVAKYLPPTLKF